MYLYSFNLLCCMSDLSLVPLKCLVALSLYFQRDVRNPSDQTEIFYQFDNQTEFHNFNTETKR